MQRGRRMYQTGVAAVDGIAARDAPTNCRAGSQTLVSFAIGDQQYAIAANRVERIIAMATVSRPAGTPKLLRGFLNVAGEPVPVLCLHSLFDLPNSVPGLWTPVLMLRGEQPLALPVDRVHRIIHVDDQATSALPANHVFNDCVECIVRWENESILVLSPERLLLEKESRTVAEFQEIARQRMAEKEGAES